MATKGWLALCGPDLGDIDVEEADRVAFELRPLRLVALHIRQARDAVALQAAVQRGSGQMGNGWLQGVKAVIQWQQCMAPECYDHCFFRLG